MVYCTLQEAWGNTYSKPKKKRSNSKNNNNNIEHFISTNDKLSKNRYRYDFSRDEQPLPQHNGSKDRIKIEDNYDLLPVDDENIQEIQEEVLEELEENIHNQDNIKPDNEDYNNLMGMACSTSSKADLKKQIYMTVVSINILEAIRFYVSFICSFAFAENKKMAGNADIIKLIKRDEALHLTNTQEILKILHSEESEGFQKTAESCQADAIEMFERAATEEKEWASYLFKDGSIIGLNETVLHQYIDWLCMSRRKTIGLPYDNVGKNPIAGWTESWMKSDSVQVAPQEHEITSYKIGASTNDLEDMNLDFEL